MGRGKKKDKKQSTAPSTSSAEEPQPSTAVEASFEVEKGLTGGPQTKTKQKDAVSSALPSDFAVSPAPVQPPPPVVEPKKDEEEDIGLGLGASKRSRKPKKKKETTPETSQTKLATSGKPEQLPLKQVSHVQEQPTQFASSPSQPQAMYVPQQGPGPFLQPTRPPMAQQGHVPPFVQPSQPQASYRPQGPHPYSQSSGPPMAPQSQLAQPPFQQLQPRATYRPQQGPGPFSQTSGPPVAPQSQFAQPPFQQSQPRATYRPQRGPGPLQQPSRHPMAPQSSPSGSWNVRPTTPVQAQPSSQESFPTVSDLAVSLPNVQREVVKGKTVAPVRSIYSLPLRITRRTNVVYKTIELFTNYYKLDVKPYTLHRYDISFTPDRPKKLLPEAFKKVKQRFFPNIYVAFDNVKNCFTLNPLPNINEGQRFTTKVDICDRNERTLSFELNIIHTGLVSLGTLQTHIQSGSALNPPMEAVQALDVILRQGRLQSYVKAGRQFFQRPRNPIDLGDGLEMWTGIFQSIICTSRLFVNVDVAHKGFPKNKMLTDLLVEDFRMRLDSPIESQRGRGAESFCDFLKALRVIVPVFGDDPSKPQMREYIVNGLKDIPSKLRFDHTDPKTQKVVNMTVAEYFQNVKKVRLRYPNLNSVWVGPRDRNICYPMEFLEVAYGQARNKQLNERQLSTMVRTAAAPPDDRKRKIEELTHDINYSNNDFYQKFGLTIDSQFYKVPAKVLQAPQLDCGDPRPAVPRQGVWNSRRFLKPQPLLNWGFIGVELDHRGCNYDNLLALLKEGGAQCGMQVAEPKMCMFNVRLNNLLATLRDASSKKITFMILVISGRLRDGYQKIKQCAERDVGIVTQCIKDQTAERRMNGMTMRNILLKVNSKLMGINQVISSQSTPPCLRDGVMVVGADVTHPSPDQMTLPSIAAVTASIDNRCFIYNLEMSIQTPRAEVIADFEEMMVQHMKTYKLQQNRLPNKIFVYRDGVSEGQFAQVLNSELVAIYNAHRRLSGSNVKPEVMFLLVQKRHHTRFFVGQQKAFNAEPGTLVDSDIVHPRELDFYLVSHQAIKGTARPTRYQLIRNDGKVPDDEIEQLTYYLCHLFSRCSRAVSYPAPTYYAHLACLRARTLTYGDKINNQELENNPRPIKIHRNILEISPMFFV